MKIIIIGARADGHANVVREIIRAEGKHTIVGFVDDDPAKNGKLIHNIPVIGNTDQLTELRDKMGIEGGIVAIGDNLKRRSLGEKIKNAGLILVNAIHPTAIIDPDVKIGEGNYIAQGVIIVTGSQIGNCVNIHTGATIDHDNIIEDGANLGPGVHTAGRVKIRKDAFLGTGAIVIPDQEVGEGAIVGAGAVVIRNVLTFSKVAGSPAHPI